MIDTLYVTTILTQNTNPWGGIKSKSMFIGYVLINKGALKMVTANSTSDINHYAKREGFKVIWRRKPTEPQYTMRRHKWTGE